MQLYKPVTSNNPLSEAVKICSEVTEVTVEVTKQSIDRDRIYNKVTSVTSELRTVLMRAHAHMCEGVKSQVTEVTEIINIFLYDSRGLKIRLPQVVTSWLESYLGYLEVRTCS